MSTEREPGSAFGELSLAPFERVHETGVVELLRTVYAEYGQLIELETLDDDLLRIPERYAPPHTFRVLLDGPRVVGSVAVKLHTPERAELKRLFLERERRGRGLGRALVDWAAGWAREQGALGLDIWSDVTYTTSHALYRSLGARENGERRRLGGINDVVELYLRLDLAR